MDGWSADDFRTSIYNDDYIRADPPIPGRAYVPPRETPAWQMGQYIASMLEGAQSGIRILDFGAGGDPGPLGLGLIDRGFAVDSYDPFRGAAHLAPEARYDVIVAIEVLEHVCDLPAMLRFMAARLKDGGLLWIQTMLHPHPAPPDILQSWYIAPRNGHISIFTLRALTLLFRSAGINIVQTTDALLGFRTLPKFPNTLFV